MAGPTASTVNFGSLIAPDVASQQLELARRQQIVDLLRTNALAVTPTETAGGMAVRQSPMVGLAKMATAYLTGQRQKDIDEKSLGLNREMATRYAQILGGGSLPGAAAGDGSSAPLDPNAVAALSQGAAAGSVGPTVANAQRMDAMPPAPPADPAPQASPAPQVTSAPQQGPAPSLQSAAPGSANFNMANLLRGSVIKEISGDPAAAAYWDQFKATEGQKTDRYLGITPDQSRATELAKRAKEGNIPPTRLGPNDYFDPKRGLVPLPAAAAPGFINIPSATDPSGWTSVQIGSGADAVRAAAKAKAAGEGDVLPYDKGVDAAGNPLPVTNRTAAATQGAGPITPIPTPAGGPPVPPPGAQPQPAVPPMVSPQPGVSGNFKGDPAKVSADIEAIPDPQQRANARAAFEAQMKATNGVLPPMPAPGAIYAAPPLGQAAFQEGQAKDASNRASATRTLAADSPTRVNVYDNILNLSQAGVNTGPGAAWQNQVKGYIANTPFLAPLTKNWKDDVSGFQELNKFLYQNAQRNWQAAGGTGTDSQLEAFSHSSPNDKMFPQALQAMAQWGKGGELAVQGKATAQDAWLAKNGDTPKQQQAFENAWRSNFAPELFQLRAMNPQAQQVFVANLKNTNPQGYAALMSKAQQLKAMGAM